jgi:hypothetical protein
LESRLINKKLDLERQLKLGIRDPKKKQYALSRLLQLESEIRCCMGFSEADVKKNDFQYHDGGKIVESKSHYVPLPSWVASDSSEKKNADQEMPKNTVREYREQMLARGAAIEAEKNKKK